MLLLTLEKLPQGKEQCLQPLLMASLLRAPGEFGRWLKPIIEEIKGSFETRPGHGLFK